MSVEEQVLCQWCRCKGASGPGEGASFALMFGLALKADCSSGISRRPQSDQDHHQNHQSELSAQSSISSNDHGAIKEARVSSRNSSIS
jgi:hypothetical protein